MNERRTKFPHVRVFIEGFGEALSQEEFSAIKNGWDKYQKRLDSLLHVQCTKRNLTNKEAVILAYLQRLSKARKKYVGPLFDSGHLERYPGLSPETEDCRPEVEK